MCGVCEERIAKFEAIEQPCKVHGCDKSWVWTKEQQLEAWVALKTDDLTVVPKPPRRMCESCRDFCRGHQDRQMPCGKPGCDYTWTYKVGAQLQDSLANRSQEPVRLACTVNRKIECEFSRHEKAKAESVRMRLPPGAELMPCVVPGCEDRWVFVPGMTLASVPEGELAPDRMCDTHRAERGLPARNAEYFADPEPVPAAPAESASTAEAEPASTAEAEPASTEAPNGDASGEAASEGASQGASEAAVEATPAAPADASGEATEADAPELNEAKPDTSESEPESADAPEPAEQVGGDESDPSPDHS